jgi:hypothetical protein
MVAITRRAWLQGAAALAFTSRTWADKTSLATTKALELPHARPAAGARHFTSEAVETLIQLAQTLQNCSQYRGIGATLYANHRPAQQFYVDRSTWLALPRLRLRIYPSPRLARRHLPHTFSGHNDRQ